MAPLPFFSVKTRSRLTPAFSSQAPPAGGIEAPSVPDVALGDRGSRESVTVHELIHSSHRLSGFGGVCRFVHGASWLGTITVSCARLPRDDRGVSLDADGLLALLHRFDHRLIVTETDRPFTERALIDPAGIVVIGGQTPGAENLAAAILSSVAAHISERFPKRRLRYQIEVIVAESDDDVFSMMSDQII